MVLFFHDEVNLTALRASSYDRPFRDARHADLFVGWQSTLREHWHSRRFNSCAVVGSSGSLLLGQPRGALIDQHDAVFRVNYAPTRGYEEYVGRKTTVWVLAWGANTSVNERHLRPKSSLGKTSALLNQTQHPARGDPHLRPPSPPQPLPHIYATLIHCQPSRELGDCWRRIGSDDPRLFGNATRFSPLAWLDLRSFIRNASGRVAVGTFPSTGALAIYAALSLCAGSSISVFGFGNISTLLTGDCALAGTPLGTMCDRYYALGPGAGVERCVSEAMVPCPPHDYDRCSRWRSSRGDADSYVAYAGGYHDFVAEWLWLEKLVASGQVQAPCRIAHATRTRNKT